MTLLCLWQVFGEQSICLCINSRVRRGGKAQLPVQKHVDIMLYLWQLWFSAKLQLSTWPGTFHLSVGSFGVVLFCFVFFPLTPDGGSVSPAQFRWCLIHALCAGRCTGSVGCPAQLMGSAGFPAQPCTYGEPRNCSEIPNTGLSDMAAVYWWLNGFFIMSDKLSAAFRGDLVSAASSVVLSAVRI